MRGLVFIMIKMVSFFLILGFNMTFGQFKGYKAAKVSVLPIFMRGFGVGFEKELPDNKSINFVLNGSFKYLFNTELSPDDYLTFTSLIYEKRLYLKLIESKISTHDGLFVGPYIKAQYTNINQEETEGFFGFGARDEINFRAYSFGPGFLGGYQSHIADLLTFELYGGTGILVNLAKSGTTGTKYFMPDLRLNASLGIKIR